MEATSAALPKLVLASASPRRREILANAGIYFETLQGNIDESRLGQEAPAEMVLRLAREKASVVYRKLMELPDYAILRGLPILGADTVVTIDGLVLGKPVSPEEAASMIRLLAGRTHEVLTGVALLYSRPGQELFIDAEVSTTAVQFCPLDERQINEYVASGEPFDKAGGYGIQGLASKFVERIEGCYFNVVGLPISRVCRMLERRTELWR